VIDVEKVQGWIEQMGYGSTVSSPSVLRLQPPATDADLPPFYIQISENWILLSILPALGPPEELTEELPRQLLFANRDMRIAKFALGKSNDVILCAELPTESLSYPELADAVQRLAGYCRHYRSCLRKRPLNLG
jgi:hypothetical protein